MEAKDLIDEQNVIRTYSEGKYICFECRNSNPNGFNGFTVRLDPNKVVGGTENHA